MYAKYRNFAPAKKFEIPKPVNILHGAPNYCMGGPPMVKPNCCILSIGNSGTAMTQKAVAYLSGDHVYGTHSQYHEHADYLLQNPHIKIVVIVRDPRDYILSILGIRDADVNLNNVNGYVPGWASISAFQSNQEWANYADTYKKFSLMQKIRMQLRDIHKPPYGSAATLYRTLMRFDDRPNTLFVRFEDLITEESRQDTLLTIGNFLALPLNDDILQQTSDNLIGGTFNYHANPDKIGYWKKHFTPELIELFNANEYLVGLCRRFGYELEEPRAAARMGLVL